MPMINKCTNDGCPHYMGSLKDAAGRVRELNNCAMYWDIEFCDNAIVVKEEIYAN